MPIPTDGKKAIYIGIEKQQSSKLILKKGDKGVVIKHTYNSVDECVFYPNQWKGYCITVFETDIL